MLRSDRADADVVIVGASFAGLAAARTAAARGLRVVVVEAKAEPGARIATTGILVREAMDEIDIPHRLTRRVPGVRLYAPSLASADLFSPGYAFFTTRTADLLRWMAAEATAAGAEIRCRCRFETARREDGLLRVAVDRGGRRETVSARFLVGADGARSRVAAAFGLARNRHFLVGLEIEFEPAPDVDPRFLHCFVNSRLAPGYIGWVAPGPEVTQVGLAVTGGRRPDLAAFLAATEKRFGWSRLAMRERRSGLIPAGGPLSRIGAGNVLLIGDAAGWVSPATGGGIRLAFRHGRRAAALIADHLHNGGPAPHAALVRELPGYGLKRAMRAALNLAPPNALLDLVLATPSARALAERIYFHRRGGRGMDRAAYLDWLERQAREAPPPVPEGG